MEEEQEQVPHIDQVQGVIIGGHGRQVNNLVIRSPREDAPLGKRKRQIFLKRIKAHVEEGFKTSLYSEVLRELKLPTLSQEVTHPWRFTFHPSLHDEYELPFGRSIKDVYEQTQSSLLILGEGGGGKTTLLFQLALHLLQQAEQDEHEPIPIIVNLSSWADKKQPFDQWLIEVLARKPYQIPHKTTQKLIKQDLLIPLLDGFNQVTETERLACARAIRDYWKEHSLIPLVICSRNDKDLK